MPEGEVEFVRNTRTSYIAGLIWGLFGLLTFSAVTWSALRDLGAPKIGWTWGKLLTADVIVLAVFGGLLYNVWADLQVRFTYREISKPGLLRRRVIQWSDVVQFERRGGIHIRSVTRKISFSPFVFKEPDKLYTFLEERLRHLQQ